jgi:hypothetical protein
MYQRIIILALLFLIPEKTNSIHFQCSLMLISDALPVQFWLIGCATYNEHLAPGVHHKCFCAPWECDDEIKVQFKDDPSQNFSLEIYDVEETLLDSLSIDEIQQGVYEVNLTLSQDSPDVCDQLIYLKIKRDQGLQGVSLPSFSSWVTTTDDPSDVDWTTGSNPNVALINDGNPSELLFVDYAFIPGVDYTIVINYTLNSGGVFNQSSVTVRDSSFNTIFSNGVDVIGGGPSQTEPLVFVADSNCTKLCIRITGSFSGGVNITLNSIEATRSIGDSEIVAKTDCLDIRQNHEQSILLNYYNHVNFAGLVYENASPSTEFNIRIPAIFFHQRFPEEDEVMELSDELVTLNGTVRKQRLLNTDYLPYYFHEKLKLILKHQSLTVFNRQWVKQEAYDIVEGNRQFPMKRANCWLSEKDFVQRNIL